MKNHKNHKNQNNNNKQKQKRHKLILGIETSCDDTSIAIVKSISKENQVESDSEQFEIKIIDCNIFTPKTLLAEFGGVVPEIVARNHADKLPILLANIFKKNNLKLEDIDYIGVTTSPGLTGPLLTGLNIAKTISLLKQIPIVPVNHIYAHIEAIFINNNESKIPSQNVSYPYLGVVLSGGHSAFFLVRDQYSFELIGTTIDDASGEAFDKGGKILNLDYPAGHQIDKYSKQGKIIYDFPIGLRHKKTANMSFSGLKTSLKDFCTKNPDITSQKSQDFYNLCASYQHAIVSAINEKLKYALLIVRDKYNFNNLDIVVGGGVANNSYLRKILKNNFSKVSFVDAKYCSDNAAMIANYAIRTVQKNQIKFPNSLDIDVKNRSIQKPKIK